MAKQAPTKKSEITKQQLVDAYMDYVLEYETHPKSVYKFAKINSMQEADFYKFFGNFQGLRNEIWSMFYDNTKDLMDKNEEVNQYNSREKLLTFFYTFFEMLTANRSYVLFTLEEDVDTMKNSPQLKRVRRNIKSFAKELIEMDNDEKNYSFLRNSERVFSEGAWLQFLFLLKFWRNDESAGFEKTDVAIEKSVNTIFDVFDNSPIEKVVDLGKFLYKEQTKA